MSQEARTSYIKAVKCLATKPSRLGTSLNLRRYDDFQAVHSSSQGQIHFVAQFLPWHRKFIHIYEKELNSCGYSGGLPRWNWVLDAKNVTKAPVWSSDSRTGFGGNGTGDHNTQLDIDGGRVMNGAFKDFELRHPVKHFLERQWTIYLDSSVNGSIFGSQYFDETAIKTILRFKNFSSFWVSIEGENPNVIDDASPGPHAMVHALVGGEFASPIYSANDPIFFLHHANIDWIWSTWQKSRKEQLMAYGGNTIQGDTTNNATLDDEMDFLGLDGPNPIVRDVMDTSKFPYCYTY